jgi:hypothetical protein
MSRHVIQDDGRLEVVVGWDPPLGTFYAQIFAPQLPFEEEELLWSIGQTRHEVRTIQALADALGDQGVSLSAETRAQLEADRAAPWEPGPLQRMLGYAGGEGAIGEQLRYAEVTNASSTRTLEAYLPDNYGVFRSFERDGRQVVLIRGVDRMGWTLEDYVLPRLASGLMFGTEVPAPADAATETDEEES